uniref:C-type lectin domain-containing protein n=1 Tax=Anopheles christyi TaxID=43041 RepID=A0A182JQ82_9DIPT
MKRSILTPSVLLFTLYCNSHLTLASNADAIGYRVVLEKSYYLGTTFRLNWHKAAAFCRSQGQFLVSINSHLQLDGVIEYIKKSGYLNANDQSLQLWTSGNDLGEQNQFLWTSTGERMVFDRWTPGEPNHDRVDECTMERCVVLQHYANGRGANYSFDDRSCQKEYFFIFAKAIEYCRSQGMSLVSIQNQEQFEAVKNVTSMNDFWKKNHYLYMWTSLNDIGQEGQYYWVIDLWRENEPNYFKHDTWSGEDCVVLVHNRDLSYTSRLDDIACSNELMFMCETKDCIRTHC